MKSWTEDFAAFWKNKFYAVSLALTAVFSYGFMVTHHTVGIDDTPYALYFEDGLAAIVGRWVMFLINKAAHISDFAPFLTDLAGVLIFMAGVTVWCVLLKRIFLDKIPMYGYILFACLFLSNPLISEVYTYYLHNGVAAGYLFCGVSLCFFLEGCVRFGGKKAGFDGKPFLLWLGSALCLWVAMGCYESFMIVYLVGVCIALCSLRMNRGRGRREASKKCEGETCEAAVRVIPALCAAALIAVVGIILRSVMILLVTRVFGLESLRDEAVQRSLTEMAGWLFKEGAFSELGMILKRVFVMYGVFGYAYYPIKIYVAACICALLVSLWRAIRCRDPWILVLAIGSITASYLLVFVEGKATLYRSAQFLPLFCAWGLLLAVFAVGRAVEWMKGKKIRGKLGLIHLLTAAALAVVVWNQCTDMNKWFYVDYLKYEDAKNTMNQIAYELEKNFDTSKPVVFTGTYSIPKSIIGDAYVDYGSETYFKMLRLTSLVDEHLLEKFNRDYGVWVAQTPSLSVLDWGRYAFDNDEELVRFFSMHGHELKPLLDEKEYGKAEEYSLKLPSFPEEGAIVDMGEYIIVHF